MRTDYHVHTERGPYTVEWLENFVRTARERGVDELGISEHGYRFAQTRSLFHNAWTDERRTEDLDDYMQMFKDAKKAGLHVKFGLELDYIPGRDAEMRDFIKSYPFDYVIGSIHWIGDFGFDTPQYLAEWDNWDVKDAYQQYFEILLQLSESKMFDFVGHADVIKVYGHEPDDAVFLQNWYERLAKSFAANDQVVEVSTAGYRKPVNKVYPAPNFLRACYAERVPIVLNSDAHRPEDVGADYDRAVEYIQGVGYNQIVTFSQHQRTFVTLT
ncbi:histidinol-phosphatase HisJ family protein [Tumebacillus flagellatus]|uniref:Histidinol-phosphatase n=1 Tax=Tumebacillus flagellatus TaxID=1157490 RepID=A0A074LUT2_9BACL|nr:histidinol-phosphatase HisJ family protein [Tumebacillus flagellatus]KEO84380.1 histidinol phosphatase [Tumebacillus flagellatus]